MCFGGGGDDGASREMIKMQKDESARAAKKEAERQANIKKGLQDIKYLFEGGRPITKNVAGKFDWKKFKPTGAAAASNKTAGAQVPGLPAGYKYTVIPGVAVSPSGAVAAVPRGGGTGGSPNGGANTPNSNPRSAVQAPAPKNVVVSRVQDPNKRGSGRDGNAASWDFGSVGSASGESPNGGGRPRDDARYGHVVGHINTPSGSPNGGGNTPNSNPQPSGTINGVHVDSRGNPTGGTTAAPGSWGIVGPDGKIYKIGDNIGTNTVVTTGKTKSWADEFLKKYKQDMINYYQPQVVEQYGKAKDETKYRHAMAGTLSSTANIGNIADLSKQNKINTGEVTSKALEATNQLSDSIDDARAGAEAQVYSTENPTVASTAASRAIKNITAEKPTLSPLGEVFNIATIGAANFLKGSTNASNRAAYGLNPVGRRQTIV